MLSQRLPDIRPPRICVCFFGLNRSLSHTVASIRENIFQPIAESGLESRVYAAFMQVTGSFSNRHSGEFNVQCESDGAERLGAHRVQLIDQAEFDRALDLEKIGSYGDAWNDGLVNTRNLCRSLYAAEKVTELWSTENYSARDLFIYLRPDMEYHDRFDLPCYLSWARRHGDQFLATPRWGLYGGLNDRFGVMGYSGAKMYGGRFRAIDAYQAETHRPLHAEVFLRDLADRQRIAYRPFFLKLRATRIRANGVRVDESFQAQHTILAKVLNRVKKLGLKFSIARLVAR
ncbi:MAG: hypothetical protein ABIY47_17300 [Opitutaceae bacterium]